MNPIHEKLRKLLALASQGVGGERDNAQAMLEALMRKHGISVDDLAGESRTLERFKYGRSFLEKKLLHQVIGSVVLNPSFYTDKRKGKGGYVWVEVTKSERLEIELRYAAYAAAMKKEMEIFYSAFIHRNQIFHSDSKASEESSLSHQELMKIALAMQGMEKVKIRRTLTNS